MHSVHQCTVYMTHFMNILANVHIILVDNCIKLIFEK